MEIHIIAFAVCSVDIRAARNRCSDRNAESWEHFQVQLERAQHTALIATEREGGRRDEGGRSSGADMYV